MPELNTLAGVDLEPALSGRTAAQRATFLAAMWASFTAPQKATVGAAIGLTSAEISDFVAAAQLNALIATDNAQSGTTYTLALADQYKEISLTHATGCALSIPLNATVAFPVGARIAVWADAAGTYTIVGVSGVTLNGISAGTPTGTMTVNGSGIRNGVVLRKTATNTWTVSGAIGAVA